MRALVLLLLLTSQAAAQQLSGLPSVIPGSLTVKGGLILGTRTVASGANGLVNALPACTAGLAGTTFYVTDQNTATAYLGATSGSGTGTQNVVCNGTAWVQD